MAISKPLFNAILIANRGEIAVRIIKTLKRLGIKSIAIYSQEDSQSQHVRDADASFLILGDTLESTYLSSKAIIAIAKISGAEAVIPGYGFLSERSEFAAACEANGLTWIGPTPQQMQQLGLKHLARDLAELVDIPLVPGTKLLANVEAAVAESEKIGYPIMVKSAAGGGGIGLEKCFNIHQLRDAFETVQHLGQTFFKNSSVFLEKYMEIARHIEVQILGNGKGMVIHAAERDCSLQRRKQKIIEEAPAVFIPENVRQKMRKAAIKLAASVSYRGIGTVEFLYDPQDESFFLLEMNTRLQVEHPITEAITGLDLVEAMVRIAANDSSYLFSDSTEEFASSKVAIEARIYGESPLQGFRPSPGLLLEVFFPDNVRIDTWMSAGSALTTSYDPLVAKLIVSGCDRAEAVENLSTALDLVKLSGIETNLEYLKRVVHSSDFRRGTYNTNSLDTFKFHIPAFEVLDPGPSTTIQDFPGRQGLWYVGIPPSGPMDNYAFQIANKLLGNHLGAAALECMHAGPKLLFHHDAYVAVAGGSAPLQIDGVKVQMFCPNAVKAGQILQLGELKTGCRAYVAIRGGLNVPRSFGSRSTFALGKIGGHCGRPLNVDDLIHFYETSNIAPVSNGILVSSIIPAYTTPWIVRVMPGPHAFPDIFAESSFSKFFTCSWKVHYNSNRVGVRLTGPTPEWAATRNNGGAAGLHPSNIHDSPYSIGSISFTGDEAVILTCDGPSLGGFVIFAKVISAEMWKVGQMKPGDEVLLSLVSAQEAMSLSLNLRNSIESLSLMKEVELTGKITDPVLGDIGSNDMKILCRQAGDQALLLEFGAANFDIRSTFRIYELMKAHQKEPLVGVIELTPGVRSLHVLYNPAVSQEKIVATFRNAFLVFSSDIPATSIPIRTFNLPLAFEHSSSLAAIERYSNTIRTEAPWLPSNVDFLRRINGLEAKQDVLNILLSATYLIVGLGDVFFGSPCAVPLDPRHRLFGMKYNPSRSFTAEGTVGLGGQYLCIYGIDSPGGYQLVGRTVPIWNRWAQKGNPWMFNLFDQIRFHSVPEQVLDNARASGNFDELITVIEDTFDLHVYEAWLHAQHADIKSVTQRRRRLLEEPDIVAEALLPPPPARLVSNQNGDDTFRPGADGMVLRSKVAGKCWKSAISIGERIEKGQILFWIEAMKMEMKVASPCDGICRAIFVKHGDVVTAGCPMAELVPSGKYENYHVL